MTRDLTRRDFLCLLGASGALLGLEPLAAADSAVRAAQLAATQIAANRAPLTVTPFSALPLGSVRATGWLLGQLDLQRTGCTGHAEELYAELGPNSAYLGGNAPDSDWERPTYYVKGLVALAYTLNDPALIARAQKWINWSLGSQQADGSFGPQANKYDWWPRMPMLYAIKDFYEATNDPRVLPFLGRYFTFQRSNLAAHPLTDWARARAGDNIEVALWLYNQTGDQNLLALADLLYAQAYPLTDILTNNRFADSADFQTQHAVNVAQYIKMPAIYGQRSGAYADRDAFGAGNIHLARDHGHVNGMPTGTEMLAGSSTTQGPELCAIVERMQSNETALMVLGDPRIGDQLERIAFNALPGAMDKQLKLHQYYSFPNQVASVRGDNETFNAQRYANANVPGPYSGYPCCRFNMHMGWAYYVKQMWAATSDNGLAALAYGPSRVTATLGGVSVTITQSTNYPFESQIRFTVSTPQPVGFPLKLRIPGWADQPTILVNGISQPNIVAGAFSTINRTWSNGDTVTLNVPMKIAAVAGINNSVALTRGPLVFSLHMVENWSAVSGSPVAGFNEYEIRPGNSWNYGLLVNRDNPGASVTAVTRPMPPNPFVGATAPVQLQVQARKVPSWGMYPNNLVANEPPESPLYSAQPTETITLIPYGAQILRVTYFPQVSPDPAVPGPARYEAERATVIHAAIRSRANASNGQFVGGIDFADSAVEFAVTVPRDGAYDLNVRYANGMGVIATHDLTVIGRSGMASAQVRYPTTGGWGVFNTTTIRLNLSADASTLRFRKGSGFAELDYVTLTPSRQRYRLINKHSRKAASIELGSLDKGKRVWQWTDYNNTDQQWLIEPTGDGYVKLRNNRSDLIMGVGGVAAGSDVDQWTENGTFGQEWRLLPTDDGYHRIVHRASGLLLEVDGASSADGGQMQLWGDNGADCQRWLIVPVGEVVLISQNSGKALEVAAGSANIQQGDDRGLARQRWRFVSLGTGYFKLVNLASNKVIDVAGTVNANGANIQEWQDLGNAGQQWRIVMNQHGYAQFRSIMAGGRAIDVENFSQASGANVSLYDAHDGLNQRWAIRPA